MAAGHHEATEGRKGGFEKVVDTIATGFGNSIGWLAENGLLFVLFGILWAAFAAGLIWSLDQVWQSIRGLPLLLQAIVWLLFLPVTVGLWVWETTWPLIVRLVLVAGIAGWNLLVFLPKAAAR